MDSSIIEMIITKLALLVVVILLVEALTLYFISGPWKVHVFFFIRNLDQHLVLKVSSFRVKILPL